MDFEQYKEGVKNLTTAWDDIFNKEISWAEKYNATSKSRGTDEEKQELNQKACAFIIRCQSSIQFDLDKSSAELENQYADLEKELGELRMEAERSSY